ncbi:MAG TPA: hypothetical protein DIW23_05805 [Anaerolineae bacterium]|nr:hypothetical protein [Anaerolineae bacterium]HRK98735.1 ASCH domain-containing protein [Alphaproteobacteria bacterium]
MEDLFDEEPKNFIISIKPNYALKIIDGVKTVELRRRFPVDNIKGGKVIVYASSPIKEIIGYAIIESVEKLSVAKLWRKYNKEACVEKDFFNTYFEGVEEGYAVSLSHPVKLELPIDVKSLEKKYKISAPQSYCYASAKILKAIGV